MLLKLIAMKEIELGLDRGRDRWGGREGGTEWGVGGEIKRERGTQSALIGIFDVWEVLMHVKNLPLLSEKFLSVHVDEKSLLS